MIADKHGNENLNFETASQFSSAMEELKIPSLLKRANIRKDCRKTKSGAGSNKRSAFEIFHRDGIRRPQPFLAAASGCLESDCKRFLPKWGSIGGFRMFTGLRELRSNGAIRMRQGRTKTSVLPIITYSL